MDGHDVVVRPCSDAEIAYLAGIMDGEGCLRLEKEERSNFYRVVLKVEMNDRKVIVWLHGKFGGYITGKKGDLSANKEYGYCWRIRERRILKGLLPRLHPFLITKKLQAFVLLEFMSEFNKGSGNGRYSENEASRMKDYYDIMAKLNSRGTGSNALKDSVHRAIESGETILRRAA